MAVVAFAYFVVKANHAFATYHICQSIFIGRGGICLPGAGQAPNDQFCECEWRQVDAFFRIRIAFFAPMVPPQSSGGSFSLARSRLTSAQMPPA